MEELQIPIQACVAGSWRQRCYDKVERLKALELSNCPDPPSQEENFGKKIYVIFELRKAIQYGNVDKFVEVLEKACSEMKLRLSAIFDQATPAGDSLLHEAAYFGKAKIAELIAHHFPQLLTSTNVDGDTPLHVAARSKSSALIKLILLHQHKSSKSSIRNNKDKEIIMTRLTNEYGNTALHEAVYSKHVEGVTLVFEADKCVAHYLNKSGKSPLYLAVLTSNKQIVDVLLEAPFLDDKPLPNCHGNSPLHAAIYAKNADLLKKIAEKRSDLMDLRDEDGGTPLHYAAATGFVEGVRELLKKSDLVALEYNTKGHLPIHLASKWGYIKVLKELLRQECADSRVLLNKKGQNILHVAVKNGQHQMVKYILGNTKLKHLTINKKDINGDTPLHLAARRNINVVILFFLILERSTDLNIMNNEGLTALDTILVRSDMQMTSQQEISNLVMQFAGAKESDKGRSMFRKSRVAAKAEMMKDRINTLMVVAILIVTVTFAAGFTVPGGVYSSDDLNPDNRGMAVLGHKTLFKMFVVLDTVAMYSSTFGSYLLLGAQIGKFNFQAYSIALFLVGLALLLMTLAFMAAVSLVVSNVSGLAAFTIYLGIIFFYYILSSSNAYLFFLCIFMPQYCFNSLKLFLGFLMSLCKHETSASKQADEEEE